MTTHASPPRIGYLLRTFPVLSETFVAGEIRALAALTGHGPVVAALYRPGPGQGGGWRPGRADALLYWRDIDKRHVRGLVRAHARFLAGAPVRAVSCLARSKAPSLPLRDRIKVPVLADFFVRHGVTHIHSHFGWEQVEMLAHLHRLTGLPYSLTLHAVDIFVDPAGLAARLSGAAFVATISRYNKALLVERLGLPAQKVHIVHCGVDLPAFPVCPVSPGPVPRLVSIGRMVPKKGFEILLRALALLRTKGFAFEAECVGDGPLATQLERYAAGLGLSGAVRFTGALEPDEARARLRRADCFVLACRQGPDGDMDGIPVALMEAMALGRPVVSTRLSGIPELVEAECGLLAEPDDPFSLVDRLQRIFTDTELAARLARGGRRRVEQAFTLEGQARRILALAGGGATEGRA
ncbi:glycosyltransferase family 4 protein [Desulfovibrio sp. JY]|nr:glycosyltransferase family 4 protein [Desulfovibrio sp. JY]